jgi:hypothetical protein
MITRDATNGLGLAVTGSFLRVGWYYVLRSHEGWLPLGALLYVVGTGLLLAGLAYLARAKGRSPAWCLLAFVGFIGLIVLLAVKDLAPGDDSAASPRDDGEKLVERAADLDYAGRWTEAVTLFERVLQEPRYQEHHQYARNSIERIREKQGLVKGNG